MQIQWPIRTEPPALAAGDAHLWAVPLNAAHAQSDDNLEILSSDERNRVGQFHLEEPRQRFTLARLALRTLLGHYLEMPPQSIEFSFGPNGKPLLRDTHAVDLRFNVSHSGELAVIGVTLGHEIGVDIEQLRKVGHVEQIARRYFHDCEVEDVLAADAAMRNEVFLKCWTGKEAVLKALGRGVTGSLRGFRVPVENAGGSWIELSRSEFNADSRCWLQQFVPSSGYVSAVACVNAQRELHCFHFDG